uniref:Thyroglobulin n=1 Tax=Knipowitschia caucasica TaxID=637954 RepID=A0AAV2MEG0_KNICA
MSELRPEDLLDLHTSAVFLNSTHFLEEVQSILGNLMMSQMMSELRLVTVTSPEFGCTPGFSLSAEKDACVLCPPGYFSSKGACLHCPSGTYQDEEGRDFCVTCPRGSSEIGASSVHQCKTECQQQRRRCSESGDFLPAQPNFLSRIWGCVTKEGAWLEWTNSETPLTDKECTALSNFRLLSDAEVQSGSEAVLLRTVTPERTLCLKECVLSVSCHHVALWSDRCELYNTSEENTDCSTATVTKGFLGNPEVEHIDWLRCAVKVRGGALGRQVFRKTGDRYSSGSQSEYSTSDHVTLKKAESGVYRTIVFSANQSTRSDVQRFCLSTCRRDACCEGYVLNENRINNGSIMCGLLHSPSVLLCSDQDWDVIGRGAANRDCGVGFRYNKKHVNFLFDIGGPALLFSRSDVVLDQMDDDKYQASLVSFSSVQLESEPKSSGSCSSPESGPESGLPVDPSVRSRFQPLSVEQVKVTPQKQPSLTFWFNKRNYSSQDALLSCLQRCLSEPLCSVADILDLHSDFFFCELFPNTAVCGDYANPERQQCLPLLSRPPNNTYIKTVDLSGPVKSFYQRVPFRKMVSYSVRTRIQVPETSSVSESFRECERRCDEDHCCRGFGLIRDPKTGSEFGLVCLPLISLGVLTCPENQTQWTTQDCSPSPLLASPVPLGWYQKPVDQWSSSPGLCPDFRLPQTRTVLNRTMWSSVSGPAQLLVDPALNTYDIIHLSRDIIEDREKALDWCLHACQESSSCFAVAFSLSASGGRCLLYPDTRVCSSVSCQLVLQEPAHQVYVRPADRVQPQTLDLPGSRSLRGQTVDVVLDSDRTRSVVQFLGVPFARPPIGVLRFTPAQPSDWTGAWDATKPRPSCVEPGRESGASEDCLYLNVFTPRNQRGALPVLVYFYNSPTGFLDGSLLSARGDLVVVSAQYRSSALGFALSDAGLSDQEAVLQWVSAHIHLVGGAKDRVTAGAERQGADMLSTHLRLPGQPLFNRLLLMGGSVFSPFLLRSDSRSLSMDLARELGCDIMDADRVIRCLQEADLTRLNQAQTRILAQTGPLTAWGPVLKPERDFDRRLHRVDLLLGTSETDGLISRARTIKKFEELSGRTDSKTVFYEALVRSLGLESDRNQTTGPNRAILKEAASWLYTLEHKPSPSSYNLFSRALDNATRDLFVVCPSLKMAEVFAQTEASVYLYHVPATNTRADVRIPIDVQFLFGGPLHPISSQRFTAVERKISEAMMSYVTQFIKTGDPNPSRLLPESVLPRWGRVLQTETTPTYLELSPTPRSTRGLRPVQCSFWNQLVPKLRGEPEAKPVLIAPPRSSVGQSQAEKDSYS